MAYSKIDFSSIRAIAHDGESLGVVIEHEDSLEIIEIPAPIAAYEGLQLLNAIANSDPAIFTTLHDANQLTSSTPDISMLPVSSSMANAIGYDGDRQLLQVEFKNGSVYQFEDVNQDTWDAIQSTDSPGRFFNRKIRGKYRAQRMD